MSDLVISNINLSSSSAYFKERFFESLNDEGGVIGNSKTRFSKISADALESIDYLLCM